MRACLDAREVACVGRDGGGYAGARPNIQRKAEKERRIIGSQQGICRPSAENFPEISEKQKFFARHAPETDFFHNFCAGKVRLLTNDGRANRGGKGDKKGGVGERKRRGGEERCGFQKKCKKVLTPRGWFGIINERSRERRTLTSK